MSKLTNPRHSKYPCYRIDPVTGLPLERVYKRRDKDNNKIAGDTTTPRTTEELAQMRAAVLGDTVNVLQRDGSL